MYTVMTAVNANMQDHLNLMGKVTKAGTFLNYTVYLSSLQSGIPVYTYLLNCLSWLRHEHLGASEVLAAARFFQTLPSGGILHQKSDINT